MKRLEIFDTDSGGALDFNLARILCSMPHVVRGYKRWCFKELEAVGKDIMRLEAEIRASPDGFCMTWDDLISQSGGIDEVINMTIVAEDSIPTAGDPLSDVLRVEVIDSTLWAVESDSIAVLDWIRSSFSRVSAA